jgi:hypothetical protein
MTKKILIICWYAPGWKNVGFRRCLFWANSLSKLGYEITYLTNNRVKIDNETVHPNIEFLSIVDRLPENNLRVNNWLRNFKRRFIPQIFDPKSIKIVNFYLFKKFDSKKSFDAIIASSPPMHTLLLGLLAKKYYNAPLLLDFRDLFAGSHLFAKWMYPFENYLQHKILSNGDKVITVSEPWLKCFPAHKRALIRNGFDADDFKSFVKVSDVSKNTIRYFGSISHPDRVSEAFINNIVSLSQRFKFEFYGDCELLKDLIPDGANVTFYSAVSYVDSIHLMKCAHANLLFGFSDNGDISREGMIQTKCYEYMAALRPILYFGPTDCSTREICLPSGLVIDDVNYLQPNSIGHHQSADINYIQSFSRQHGLRNLVQLIADVTNV